MAAAPPESKKQAAVEVQRGNGVVPADTMRNAFFFLRLRLWQISMDEGEAVREWKRPVREFGRRGHPRIFECKATACTTTATSLALILAHQMTCANYVCRRPGCEFKGEFQGTMDELKAHRITCAPEADKENIKKQKKKQKKKKQNEESEGRQGYLSKLFDEGGYY